MNCKRAESFLIDYLYHELPARKVVQIEKHLKACDRCTKSLESWRAIHLGYQRSVQEPKVSPYLKQRILAAANEELRRSPSNLTRLMSLLRPAMLVPAFLIAVFGLVFLFRNDKTDMAKSDLPSSKPVVEKQQPPQTPAPAVKGLSDKLESYAPPADTEESGEYERQLSKDGNLGRENRSYRQELQRNEALKEQDDADRGRRDEPVGNKPPMQSVPEPASEMAAAPPEERRQKVMESEKTEGKSAAPVQLSAATESADEDLRQSQVFLEQGDLKNAVIVGQSAAKKDKSGLLATQFYQTGITYQARGRCYEAIAQFNLIQNNYKSYTNMPDVLRRLGECYISIGQYEDAKKSYQQLQKFASMRDYADRKIVEIEQKQQAQEQLKSLGYVQEKQ